MRRAYTVLAAAIGLELVIGWSGFSQEPAGNGRQLLDAAKNGEMSAVKSLVETGAFIAARDEEGRTALHLAAAGGHQQTAQALLEMGADINARDAKGRTPVDLALEAGHDGMTRFLRDHGGSRGSPEPETTGERTFSPNARHTTAEAFAEAIGEPAAMLDSPHVRMLAPKRREAAANIVFPYLVRAYDELYSIAGVHTKFKMLIYAYPKGHPKAFGGTGVQSSQITYDDTNLDLDQFEEWKRRHIPHVSGYIEEMAHNFVYASKARYSPEMLGWALSVDVTRAVAGNSVHEQSVTETRRGQERTYRQYLALHQTVPAGLAWNQADRIHAWLLYQCQRKYGAAFWRDFFAEVRKARPAFLDAELEGEGEGRDARFRLTLQCFDRLPGVKLTELLEQNGVSTTKDLGSLGFNLPDWNRKLH